MKLLYEDEDILVLVKPSGVTCEDGENSVPELIRQMWGKQDAYVGVVTRLDTPVGGVMVYGKTKRATSELIRQSRNGELHKKYVCICAGVPECDNGEMRDFLFKDSRQNKVFPVKHERKGAKEAVLRYSVIDTAELNPGENVSLCEVRLVTGRTHQIRAQFASRGHPLAGDGKYGSRIKCGIALWCMEVSFSMPGRGILKFAEPCPDVVPFNLFGPSLQNFGNI